MPKKTKEQIQQEIMDEKCAALAEDAGHMGWTRDNYPGCPSKRAKEVTKFDGTKLTQLELGL